MQGLNFAANVSFLWPEVEDPLARLSNAASAGFTRVERTFVHDVDARTLRLRPDEALRVAQEEVVPPPAEPPRRPSGRVRSV